MTVVAMSHGELSRYNTLRRFERGEWPIENTAMLLGVSRRQVYRFLGRLRNDGPEALVSWKRGRPSNRSFSAEFRTRVIDLAHYRWYETVPVFPGLRLEIEQKRLGSDDLQNFALRRIASLALNRSLEASKFKWALWLVGQGIDRTLRFQRETFVDKSYVSHGDISIPRWLCKLS
ncbi:helix-turn-helix domain-containing protein [Novosphingobium sp. BL-52-GroH]|uniref:helix-turn-helix domain-containing protein n=1 Tax=Novosphingobium sp. BL-52-GroH TaxID=3349877 RepID=UPI00384FD04F